MADEDIKSLKGARSVRQVANRRLANDMLDIAATALNRISQAFDVQKFLLTAKAIIPVILAPIRLQIAASGVFQNANYVHVNSKNRYRLVLGTAFVLDNGATGVLDENAAQLANTGLVDITRRDWKSTEGINLLGAEDWRQGSVAAGPAAVRNTTAWRSLYERLCPQGTKMAQFRPFDFLQPDEQFSQNFNNLSGTALTTPGGANATLFMTMRGVALDITQG